MKMFRNLHRKHSRFGQLTTVRYRIERVHADVKLIIIKLSIAGNLLNSITGDDAESQ